MADLLTAPVHTAGRAGGNGRAALALARVEAARFLRHPLTVAALLLFVSPWVYDLATGTANRFPVLADAAVDLQVLGLFALGGGAMVTAHLAALRAHRHNADELFDTLVLLPPWRTLASLLALLPYAGVVAVLVAARLVALALRPGAVGVPDLADAAVVPAVVALFGAVGVLLARLWRSAVAAPVALVVFAVVMFAGLVAGVEGPAWWRQALPIMIDDRGFALPAGLVDRPSGRHLVYLGGILVVVALAAIARSGARRVVVPLLAAVALTAAAGAAQFRGDPALQRLRADVTRDPAPLSTCRTLGDVRYCAFDEFTPWIAAWDEVVRGVLRAAPAVTGPPLVVRQRVWADGPGRAGFSADPESEVDRVDGWRRADADAGFPEAVMAGTAWGSDVDAATLAAAVAYRVVSGVSHSSARLTCGAQGALLIWLVGHATPGTAAGLRRVDEDSSGAIVFSDFSLLTTIAVPDRVAAPALALLTRPAAEAEALVRANWAELADPATSVERFGALLGVPVPPLPPVEERPVCAG
ncbi:ABC transporter [Dactylosporangium darangshiense]|uniref:ABC transporter n=1 Tax=Dactylosporangium darangshiense TaxID=579108 RepID=A0ABP8DJ05_9ACTN